MKDEHSFSLEQMQQEQRCEDECDQPDPNPAKTAYERLMAHHERQCTPPGVTPDLWERVSPMFERLAQIRRGQAA